MSVCTSSLRIIILVAMVSMLVACVASNKDETCIRIINPTNEFGEMEDGVLCASWPCPPVC